MNVAPRSADSHFGLYPRCVALLYSSILKFTFVPQRDVYILVWDAIEVRRRRSERTNLEVSVSASHVHIGMWT